MADMRFGVLGALEVRVAGRLRTVPPGRRRAVLCCLLVHAGHPVSAAALVEAAWPAELPNHQHNALRTILSRLRAELGRGAIVKTPTGYRLVVDQGMVDAEEFTDLLAQARSAEPAQARDLLGLALGLWRGPAYGEYADAPFATAAAQHLEQLRMEAVETHAAALVQAGQPSAAVPGLVALLEEEPFREYAVEQLVTALYHGGRQAEALQRLRDHRTLLATELGLDPAPALTGLERRILGHEVTPVHREQGLPAWLDTSDAFIGREDDLADLVAAVADNHVTLVTGPGGVGKSRLAAEALAPVHTRLGLPLAVAELAAVTPGRAAAALADTLGLRPTGGSAADEVVEFLAAVPHLLVMDNCEHLVDELAPLVSAVARRCPGVRMLATSRRRLGVPSERVLPLAPLRLPDPGVPAGNQASSASVRLFGDRVRRLRPVFAVTPDNLDDVAELCRRCDGLPLALELAASRAATSGVREVLDRFPADLTGTGHGGLGAVVTWSYRLLEPDQRLLLCCLSVFAGDFTVTAVRGLVERLPGWKGPVTAAFAELVESSLVAYRGQPDGREERYGLLEMVRAFAAERLQESGMVEEVRLAHAEWVRTVMTGISLDWSRVDGAELSALLSGCSAEVARALRWCVDAGQGRLAAEISHAVTRCWHWTPDVALRDLMIEAAEREMPAPGPEVTAGVAAGAFASAERGAVARAAELATVALRVSGDTDAESATTARLALAVSAMYSGHHAESVRRFREVADIPELTGEANSSLALLACYADDLASAREHAEVALAAGAAGSDHSHAFARYAAGEVAARTDPGRGVVLLSEAAAEADRVDAEQVSRVSRIALFALLVRNDRHDEAAALGERLVRDLRRLGAWTQVWTLLRIVAELLAAEDRWSDAAFCLGAARGAPGAPPAVGADVERYAALRARLSDRLGVKVLEQIEALATGTPRAQTLSRAEQVLADLPRRRNGGSPADPDVGGN